MKILTIIGASPQFIKAAVLRKSFLETEFREILMHTGQHYDHLMSEIFFRELNIKKPDYFFNINCRSHAGMISEIILNSEKVMLKEKPDFCLLYGDTNSTLAGALAASKLNIPICHVEAGLRSFDNNMPEEINRKITDHLTQILFCPTKKAVENLKKENITENVIHVGDIMYDAVKLFKKNDTIYDLEKLLKFKIHKPLAILTIHREYATCNKNNLLNLINFIHSFVRKYQIIFPIHPRTKIALKNFEIKLDKNIKLLDPISYKTMQSLISISDLVLTDSGGLQKESYFNGTRCITLRENTECVETIENGWNKLMYSDDYNCEPKFIDDYGDGNTARKIIKFLREY